MTEPEARQLLERALTSLLGTETTVSTARRGPVPLRDLGADSVRLLFELATKLETMGGFILDDYDVTAENFATVESLVATLRRYELSSAP
ncbi:hypothetical protein [Mycobacterium riyadhense]|nr:hypothetical protein [Mycobacterium riyadhense]MCV7147009.1 hypothetical protein [Mycobacterium riyadhense]VTP00409.1 hypothetical protein BIN_B_03511 [Mycobacterium riyadhense]